MPVEDSAGQPPGSCQPGVIDGKSGATLPRWEPLRVTAHLSIEDVTVEPMTERFILWRCLHSGPLSRSSLDRWPADSTLPWASYRQRNLPLLLKLTRTYGACAILAWAGDHVVGQLRFYPAAVWDMVGAGGLCLQQDPPSGPVKDFAYKEFPALPEIEDKTLVVHCLMTGSPQAKENPYQRKGIGSRLVRTLIDWAKANGWRQLEARAFEDLPIIYEITGSAGHTFWEKFGFRTVTRGPHPDLQDRSEFVITLEEQAEAIGLPADRAREQIIMRLDLASGGADISCPLTPKPVHHVPVSDGPAGAASGFPL